MNSQQSSTTTSGVGFAGLLAILFIALKLTGYITWDWLWVLSPIWISCLLGIVMAGAIIVGYIIVYFMREIRKL